MLKYYGMQNQSKKSAFFKSLKYAFPYTVPVMTGYAFLGIAFGILLESKGYNALWALFMSIVCYCGSGQYVGAGLLATSFNPLYTIFITLSVNARHLFYGITMLERYNKIGKTKPFLIFGMTDETYSIVSSINPPVGVSKSGFYFWITLFNYLYWVIAGVVGALIGSLLPFDIVGLDFVLTALFVVILLEKIDEKENRIPALVGIVCTAVCLFIFGANIFLIPSMISITIVIFALRPLLDKKDEVVEIAQSLVDNEEKEEQ